MGVGVYFARIAGRAVADVRRGRRLIQAIMDAERNERAD
jgi:hypothetical protein